MGSHVNTKKAEGLIKQLRASDDEKKKNIATNLFRYPPFILELKHLISSIVPRVARQINQFIERA
jgi:hypothetical protein